MNSVINNLRAVLLLALGALGASALIVRAPASPLSLLIVLACEVLLCAVFFLDALSHGQRAKDAITQSVSAIGVIWAGFGWTLWPLAPGRSSMSALLCGVILAPAYLLVAARRRHGIGMRTFVGLALVILVLYGTQVWPAGYFAVEAYLLLPPLAGLLAGLLIPQGEHPIPPGFCQTCGYNLTGNVCGICPECGTPIPASAGARSKPSSPT